MLQMAASARRDNSIGDKVKLGALDFLEKPFEDDRLIGMVETALAESSYGAV